MNLSSDQIIFSTTKPSCIEIEIQVQILAVNKKYFSLMLMCYHLWVPINTVQGWSDKYLAYKRKKQKFWKSGDLFLNIVSF